MSNSPNSMDAQEKKIQTLAEDMNPSEHSEPDSLAEATTAAPLEDDELDGNASGHDANK